MRALMPFAEAEGGGTYRFSRVGVCPSPPRFFLTFDGTHFLEVSPFHGYTSLFITLRIDATSWCYEQAMRSAGRNLRAFFLHERMSLRSCRLPERARTRTPSGRYLLQRRPSRTDHVGHSLYEWAPSDDGQYAIVEFVAKDRGALTKIANDARVLKAFEKGKVKKDDVEKELKRYRKDFKFEKQGGRP